MSHGDRGERLPPGFAPIGDVALARRSRPIADEARKLYGVQFHPEVVHTPDGARLHLQFRAQGRRAPGPTGPWRAFRGEAVAAIRAQVGSGRVLCGLSGGVDSAVAAVLILRGDRRAAHLRLRRSRDAAPGRGRGGRQPVPRPLQYSPRPRRGEGAFSRRAGRRRATRKKSARSSGACSSRRSRREAKKIAADGRGALEFLAQGTLYPDVIESVSFSGGPSVTIKSHHNVGGLPERMNMKLVEPLARTVQGRGARARPRTWPSRGFRRPASVPGAGPRHPLPRRRDAAKSSRSSARPTPSISTKSARPGFMTRSGRLSPCCCRCRPSA